MAKPAQASRLRQRVAQLRAAREPLERTLLGRGRMVDACLIMKRLPDRQTPAYYLTWKEGGQTRSAYVRQEELAAVQQAATAWRTFGRTMAHWTRLTRELERCFRRLRQAQIVPL